MVLACVSARRDAPLTRQVREVVIEEGGKPVASLWGDGSRTSVTGAVLVNSTAGHAFEMDDVHKESIVHPNSLAVPIAIALAEADRTLTWRDIVTALTLGPSRQCIYDIAFSERFSSPGHVGRLYRCGHCRAPARARCKANAECLRDSRFDGARA
jgi:2-methylcitrate dehydratase PrpD